MKRDPRLHGLSSEHHHALVLARRVGEQAAAWSRERGAELAARFGAELEPHFGVEEDLLLPALRAAGEDALASRTADEHARLRDAVARAAEGDAEAARAFAALLTEHVRFEERELFAACETKVPGPVLDAVRARAPGPRETAE